MAHLADGFADYRATTAPLYALGRGLRRRESPLDAAPGAPLACPDGGVDTPAIPPSQ